MVASVDGGLQSTVTRLDHMLRLLGRNVLILLKGRVDGREVLRVLDRNGVGASGLILVTGLATGAVMVMQTVQGLARFGAEMVVARIVGVSLVRELAPVLTGLLLAGRASGGISATLGSMAITEQLAAMRSLALDVDRHLVAPRLVGLTLALPCLVLIFDAAGIAGGYFAAVLDAGLPSGTYLNSTWEGLRMADVGCGLVKGGILGFLIGLVGCSFGLTTDTRRGARAVGESALSAVVLASLLVLLADAAVTKVYIAFIG